MLIIDTDGGMDDAMAIVMTIECCGENELEAITTVHGNVPLHQVNANIQFLLRAVHDNKDAIKVYSGAARPLIRSICPPWSGHGPDGFGGLVGIVDNNNDDEQKRNEAVFYLVETVSAHPNQVTIVAIGPLTNLALAISLDPTFVLNVQRIIFLGGTLQNDKGNATKAAEFNVGSDPEAAHIVMNAFRNMNGNGNDKLVIVPLETCINHGLSWNFYDLLIASADDAIIQRSDNATKYARLLKGLGHHYEQLFRHKDNTFVPCDVYAILTFLHYSTLGHYVVNERDLIGSVELDDHDHQRGMCLWSIPSLQGISIPSSLEEQPYEGDVEFDLHTNNSTSSSSKDEYANVRVVTRMNQSLIENVLLTTFSRK